jgi:hypothetical protein
MFETIYKNKSSYIHLKQIMLCFIFYFIEREKINHFSVSLYNYKYKIKNEEREKKNGQTLVTEKKEKRENEYTRLGEYNTII